ncbi:retrovirus-related pol polyprotein from transposon TNT 1-94 [Tanacetum coccineum]
MQEELNEFERLKVWELVPRPDKVMVITLKWIYKVKLDELGGIIKNKARDFAAFAAYMNMFRSTKWIVKDSISDWEDNELLLVQIYVDDIIFVASTPELYDLFAKIMCSKFKMSMMGKISFFFGLQISQNPRGIFINQSKYTLESLKKYSFDSCDPVDTPMVEKSKLDEDKEGKAVDPSHYRGMIGTLLYLTASRPNLQFAICMCARKIMSITKEQQQALDNALVPWEQRLMIESCNYRLSTTFKPKEPTFKVALDVLSLTPFYQAFLITTSVPAIYMHEL